MALNCAAASIPDDILPLLQELEHDDTARVRKTLVHVIGQISYDELTLYFNQTEVSRLLSISIILGDVRKSGISFEIHQ